MNGACSATTIGPPPSRAHANQRLITIPDEVVAWAATEAATAYAEQAKETPKVNGTHAEAKPTKLKPKLVSAPVSRDTAVASGNLSNTQVKLTAGEARAATDGTHTWNYDDPSGKARFKKGDPIGVQEFARRKKMLTEQGAYDKIAVQQ